MLTVCGGLCILGDTVPAGQLCWAHGRAASHKPAGACGDSKASIWPIRLTQHEYSSPRTHVWRDRVGERGRSPKIVLPWRNDAEGVRPSSRWNSQSTLATQGCVGTGVRKRVRYESAGL